MARPRPRLQGGIESLAAVLLDAALAVGALEAAARVRFGPAIPPVDARELQAMLPLLLLCRLGTLYAAGIYRRSFRYPRGFDYADLVQAWAAGTVLLAASVFFGRILEASRLVLVYEALLSGVGLWAWRALLALSAPAWSPPRAAVLLGDPALVDRLNHFLSRERWGWRITGAVRADELSQSKAAAVFVESSQIESGLLARARGRRLFVLAGNREVWMSGAAAYHLGGCVVLDTAGVRQSRHYLLAKRALDLAVGLAGLLVFLPLAALVAALVKFSSPGPVFYSQERVGRGGFPFSILKFRTMHAAAGGPSTTRVDDDRVFPFGRFLRRWSLDELPQLVNIVAGHMSLVGPRPDVPEAVADWPESRRAVLDVQPGLTGLVQVMGRDELTEEEKARLDLFYALNRSLEMDLSILLRTGRALARYRGRA